VENRTAKIEQDKQISVSPGFWDDNKRATATIKEIKVNEYWVTMFTQVNTAVEDFAVLFDFWKEGEATEEDAQQAYDDAVQKIEEAEFKSTLNEPEDERLCKSTPEQVVLKVRIGPKCWHVCLGCMAKNRAGP
jgi:peptide chain release factor 2